MTENMMMMEAINHNLRKGLKKEREVKKRDNKK
jgi:hypothetical protein